MALSPAELQALEAARLASPMGEAAAPPLPTPGAGSTVQPYSVTNQSIGPSTTSGSSTEIQSGDDTGARRAAKDALIASAKAQGEDIATGPVLTPEEVAADSASKESSAKSLARQASEAPNPANLPPVMGLPIAIAGATAPPRGREYTSQEFNASGAEDTKATGGRGGFDVLTGKQDPNVKNQPTLATGIAGPQTLSQAKDERATVEAALQLRLKDEEAVKRAQEQERAQKAAEDWRQDLARTKERIEAAQGALSQDNRSGVQKFLSAIAVGMGAYGAAITHSPNYAQEILNKQIDDDYRRKKDVLDTQIKHLDRLGVDRQRIDEFQDHEMAKFLAGQQVKIDQTKAASAAAFARFPQNQQAAKIATAAAEANVNSKIAEIYKDFGKRTSSSSATQAATTVQTVEGKDQTGGQGRVTPDSVDQLVRARQNAANMNKINAKDLPTGKEWDQILRNEHAIIAQNASEVEGGVKNVKVGDFMRWIGAMPTNIYPDTMSDEKKEAARVVLEQAHALFAKRWTPGSISQPEAYAHGMGPLLPQPGDKPSVVKHKFNELKDYANGLATEMEKVLPAAVQERKTDAKAAAAAAPQKSVAEQQKALITLPKDDRAAATRAMRIKPGDPSYQRADAWLREKGVR